MLIAAALLSASFCLPQMTVLAQEPEEKIVDIEPKTAEESEEEEMLPEISSINHLLVPQKLQVVIDPWEMDGKGQIYSEQYTIKNDGEVPGTLKLLDLACQIGDGNSVTVKDSPEGLHDDKNKSVYMEIVFGNKEKVILSQEGTAYEAEMKPGEELTLNFSGEVNENAAKGWKDGDIGVKVTYSWEPKEMAAEAEQTKEIVGQEVQETDLAPEKKEESEIIELKDEKLEDFRLDSWKIDEEGKICSLMYKLKNTGEETGIFVLSEMVCKPAEQSGIVVQTEKEKLHEGEGRFVYMELIPQPEEQEKKPEEEKEKYILQAEFDKEEPGVSEYKMKLEPGEEVTFRFVGELYGIKPEELEKGDVAVTAIWLWMAGEAVE